MKRCHRCNREFTPDRKFCEYCGSKLVDPRIAVNSFSCPNCDDPVQPEWKFCKNCRTRLAVDTMAPLPPEVMSSPVTIAAPAAIPTPSKDLPELFAKIVIRCLACKQLVEEDSAFCEYCGTSMAEDVPPPEILVQTVIKPEVHSVEALTVPTDERAIVLADNGKTPLVSGQLARKDSVLEEI